MVNKTVWKLAATQNIRALCCSRRRVSSVEKRRVAAMASEMYGRKCGGGEGTTISESDEWYNILLLCGLAV